ncbi:ABC-type transport auxiliary lipoprotein family protein [Sphingomonas sp. MMS24-JH45]
MQVPSVPAAIAVPRVPVRATDVSLAYVKDAAWSEPPARLFARLLSDTLTARANMVVLTPAQSFDDPSATLGGELRYFGLDAGTRSAVVTYDATLVRAGQTAVEKRRFEASVPVAALHGVAAGPALNQVANQVATEVADGSADGSNGGLAGGPETRRRHPHFASVRPSAILHDRPWQKTRTPMNTAPPRSRC